MKRFILSMAVAIMTMITAGQAMAQSKTTVKKTTATATQVPATQVTKQKAAAAQSTTKATTAKSGNTKRVKSKPATTKTTANAEARQKLLRKDPNAAKNTEVNVAPVADKEQKMTNDNKVSATQQGAVQLQAAPSATQKKAVKK